MKRVRLSKPIRILTALKSKQNLKIIEEISDIIRIKRNWKGKKLTPEEIVRTNEFQRFNEKYPEICKKAGMITFYRINAVKG